MPSYKVKRWCGRQNKGLHQRCPCPNPWEEGGRRVKSQKRKCDNGSRGQNVVIPVFEEEKGHDQGMRAPSRSRKRQENRFSLRCPPKRDTAWQLLILAQWDPFGPQTSKTMMIHLNCFKSLHLVFCHISNRKGIIHVWSWRNHVESSLSLQKFIFNSYSRRIWLSESQTENSVIMPSLFSVLP